MSDQQHDNRTSATDGDSGGKEAFWQPEQPAAHSSHPAGNWSFHLSDLKEEEH